MRRRRRSYGGERFRWVIGDDGRAHRERTRPRRWRGQEVNEEDHPRAPGPWIDEHSCALCGEHYKRTSYGVDMGAARARLRQRNPDGGGWASRGSLLWAMRAEKLDRWYADHWKRHGHAAEQALEQGWDPELETLDDWWELELEGEELAELEHQEEELELADWTDPY